MNWYKNMKYAAVDIYPFYEEDSEIAGIDTWDVADHIDNSFQQSGIRPSNNQQYSHFALMEDQVAGGAMDGWSIDDGIAEYSFDIAVHPQYRGFNKIGIKLIEEAIKKYEMDKLHYEEMGYDTKMRLWVVNPKLVPFLEKHYDFEIESLYEDGSAHMERY